MPLVRRLAVLAALLVAAAAWSAPAFAADIAPVNDVAPKLSDYRPRVGETISVTTGTWHDTDDGSPGQPITYTYQWYRCGISVGGATSSSYTTSVADDGCALQARVFASNVIAGITNTTSAYSDTTLPILPRTLVTDHFVIHYTTDRGDAAAITDVQAGEIASFAEQAYAAETALGYTIPGDGSLGGDSRVDIRVTPLGAGVYADTVPDDGTAAHTTSYIEMGTDDPADGFALYVVAHELFHVVQINIWLPSSVDDYWLLEGSAEAIGDRLGGFPTSRITALDGDWSMALDCRNTFATTPCDLTNDFKGNGYTRWPFFEYLYERYGADALSGIFQQGAASGGNATAALSREIAAKGGSFADFFTDWAVANATGAYSVPALNDIKPAIYGTPIAAGTLASLNLATKAGAPKVTSGAIPTLTVPVNHLGVRYVEIDRGDSAAPDAPCYAATLKLNVTVPSGSGAKPTFWWSQKAKDGSNMQAAQVLSSSGGVASVTVPWDTCQWDSTPAYLILANPSTSLDGATFGISGTLTVDRNTEATPTAPPDPVKLHGSTVDTPTSSSGSGDVPQVEVFGPQVLRIAPGARQIRLIVQSDGSGQLKAALGSVTLGTKTLRAGGNDLRFSLPTKALQGIRRVSAAANVLTLTPLSSGGSAGKPITRRVVVQALRRR